jgi:Holliday junction resolvase RusA-like endonuclease
MENYYQNSSWGKGVIKSRNNESYRRKVTNRGKTDVLSKPLKRRIRMGYTCIIYESNSRGHENHE